MNILFKDKQDNEYYVEKDVLFVKLVKFNGLRRIGHLTYSFITQRANLTVHRSSEERYLLGYFISAPVFSHLNIDKVTLIVDNKQVYLLEWDQVYHMIEPCKFIPTNGMEDQYLIPMEWWQQVGEFA